MKKTVGWILIVFSLFLGIIALLTTIIFFQTIETYGSNEATWYNSTSGLIALITGLLFLILLQIGLRLKRRK